MTTNQILVVVIVVLVSIIVIFGTYFLVLFIINKKREKKIDNIFNPTNLVEEESLMNVMDDKKNIEFRNSDLNDEKFVMNNEEVKIITSDGLTQEEKINPFGVDLTMRTKDNVKLEIKDTENKNKFFN